MNTIALSTPGQSGTGWDLLLDANGNLATNTGNAALAQDVASACRTFVGEAWYDSTLGVPYFKRVLGQRVSLQYIKQALISAGSTVPGVASIACFLTGPGPGRSVGGQLQITASATGQTIVAQTGNILGAAPWWVSGATREAVTTIPTTPIYLTDPASSDVMTDPATGLPMTNP